MEEKSNSYEFKGTGLSASEKRKALSLFNEYKSRHHIDRFSDLGLLEELCFAEIMQERYKTLIVKIERLSKKKPVKDGVIKNEEVKIPQYVLDFLNDNLEKILTLKEKLGLFAEEKGEDPFKYLQRLDKKFHLWEQENQGSREVVCPFCSKLFFLHIRTDKYEAVKTPFFKDKILTNKALWDLFKQGKITKEDIAKVLGTSADYVSWLEEKIFSKDSDTPSE